MKVHVPLGKPQPWVLYVTIVCFAFGAFIASKMRTTPDDSATVASMRPEQLAMLYANAKQENDHLSEEIIKLREQLDAKLEVTATKEIQSLRAIIGLTPVEGEGIVITIDDTDTPKLNTAGVDANAFLTHDVDLLMLINELQIAGAEAIAINDQRVAGTASIRCVGPVVQVNGNPVSAPFIIKAIGKVDTLYGAVNIPGGVLDYLKSLNNEVNVAKREKLRVPSMAVAPTMKVGTPVTEEKSGASVPR